jgi:hypothetical protein
MRKQLLLLPLVLACAKTETAQTDTAAMAMAPATLSANDVAGTWNGQSKREGSDSVVARWTVTATATESKLVYEGTTDSVAFANAFDGDSMVATSQPFDDPLMPGADKVVFRSVARLQAGKLVGTTVITMADKPDSVVARGTWEATRAP